MATITLTPAALDAVYAEMPGIACQQKCRECCSLILMSRSEDRRIREATGRPFPEANMETLECGWLTEDGRCSHYQLRPGICRLWGVVESMRCPFGCEILPAQTGYFSTHVRALTEAEGHRFLLRLGSDVLGPLTEAQAAQVLASIQRQRKLRARAAPPGRRRSKRR